MEMPKVSRCEVSECAYNMQGLCHAMAITVGNSDHPRCDTFCRSANKGGDMNCIASVGACKTSSCMFNQSLECQASQICVGYKEDEVDCLTFCTG